MEDFKNPTISKQEVDEIGLMAEKIATHLRENHNPYVSVTITGYSVKITQDLAQLVHKE